MPCRHRFVAQCRATAHGVCAALIAAGAAACTTAGRQAGGGSPIAEPSRAAAYHQPWRPKHQGGADLSTGSYVREDDDLVIDTPMPIVLRRTWSSADLISRQFGLGASVSLLDCPRDPAACSLERRDADGHRISYVHDTAGLLLRIESEGQSIAFDYDDHQRIVRAYDTLHREVRYTYDERGRLVRAAASGADVRSYEFDDHDRLSEVREPGRIVQNWYDAGGRWAGQLVKDSDEDPDPYMATARYVVEGATVAESDFDEGYGHHVVRYNATHDTVSETLAAGTPYAVAFEYQRDAVKNAVTGVTLTCAGPSGPVTKTVRLESAPDRAKYELVRETCQAPSGRYAARDDLP